jgi:O-antigen biosynthesis protein
MTFSCMIAAYNPKPHELIRAIESARGLFDEIILVDDGSHPAIHLMIPLEGNLSCPLNYWRFATNRGVCTAVNQAVSMAQGDIIATVDQDDYFDRVGVIALKAFVEQYPSDIWHFPLQMFNTDNGRYGENADPRNLTEFNPIPGMSWYTRKLREELGGLSYPLACDWDFWLRCYRAGKKFTYFPEVVYHYNKRLDSMSSQWIGPVFEQMRREILARNPE